MGGGVRASVPATAPPGASTAASVEDVQTFLAALGQASVAITDDAGAVVASKGTVDAGTPRFRGQNIVDAIGRLPADSPQIAQLWDILSDTDNGSVLTVPVVSALVSRTTSEKARDAMWSELASQAKERGTKSKGKSATFAMLASFERHRATLRPLFGQHPDSEQAGNNMLVLMTDTKVFGADFNESLAWVAATNPGALARRIERDRVMGKAVAWEGAAFEQMLKWKRDHLVVNAPKAPKTLAEWDRVGSTYALIFNCLHPLDDIYRKRMLEGLGPVQVLNVVVGGEFELYRMGTSSYRGFLHGVLLKGVKESGSFEAFLKKASASWAGQGLDAAALQRGMVLLRVASSFGNLDEVLQTVADREAFIDNAIHSLADETHLERNGLVVLDLLTSQLTSASARAFRDALRDTLYKSYLSEPDGSRLQKIYGSLISVYQTVTGDRREPPVDVRFPIDDAVMRVPFQKLFTAEDRNRYVHRIFMRLDEDTDAVSTYESFRALARKKGAAVRAGKHHDVFRFSSRGRAVEVYVNKPTAQGVSQGISDIAADLRGRRVETVVGRGHSGIIKPLKESSKRVLGNRFGDVALVVVGTCGGDASVPDLVDMFGYVAFYATRSTGRQAINNAIMDSYIDALLALQPGRRLSLSDVLDTSTRTFMSKRGDTGMRDDASFYELSAKRVMLARLLDEHAGQATRTAQQVAR